MRGAERHNTCANTVSKQVNPEEDIADIGYVYSVTDRENPSAGIPKTKTFEVQRLIYSRELRALSSD